MNSKYKLYYLPFNGRAAGIRALLSYKQANWENIIVNHTDWNKLKHSGKFEFSQLPCLLVDEKPLVQTLAIENFLAKRFNLLGSNENDEYNIISLVCTRDDFSKYLKPIIFPSEEEKKNRDNIINKSKPFFIEMLKIFENRLNQSNGKYYIGDKITLADIYIATQIQRIYRNKILRNDFESLLVSHAPKVTNLVDSLFKNELKEYYNKYYIAEAII